MKHGAAFLFTALFYCAGAQAAPPQYPSLVVSTFGMIGIADSETARLNLVNIDDPNIISIIPNLCQAHLRFLDEKGNVLAKSDVSLTNAQAGYLDFAHAKIPEVEASHRRQIRPEVATLESPVIASVANCIATIEIFNSHTGQTTVIYPAAPRLDLGNPDIPPVP